MGRATCPECGLDPAIIVAARGLGVARQPRERRERETKDIEALKRRLAKMEAEVARLRAEIEQDASDLPQ